MRVVFLCSSLEPSKDGVGDYTRALARKLIKFGNRVSIIGLNDKFVESVEEGLDTFEYGNLAFCRLPSHLPRQVKKAVFQQYINSFQPDFISLQFVPFGFDSKGLPFLLPGQLGRLKTNARWHIMFHELWVGMDTESPLKHRLWGWLQKKIIQSLIHQIKPVQLHTQTYLYQVQLKKIGVKADYLPLYGNIPVAGKSATAQVKMTDTELRFVVFGSIHHGAPIDAFLKEVSGYCHERGCEGKLILVGRNGSEEPRWAAAWRLAGLIVEQVGEQDAEAVSRILGSAHVGITTTPYVLVQKSGTAAAMVNHQLPILCVARSWTPRGISMDKTPDGILEYKPGNFALLMANRQHTTRSYTVADVARQFADSLQING